nr:DMT family transporter [uncultured Fusobacterium sp.]
MTFKNKGIALGLISALLWSIDTIILSKVAQINTLIVTYLIITFSHDFFSSIFLYINLLRKKYKLNYLWKNIKKSNLIVMIVASIFGGPLGMACYLLSTKYIGVSYTSTISVLYPIFGAILAKLLFKKELTKNKIFSIFLSVVAISILTFSFKEKIYIEYKLGLLFSSLCVLGWAFEGNIAEYFMKEEDIPSEIAIFIRQLTSSVFYILFIIPYFNGIENIKVIWSLGEYRIITLLIASFLGALSYLFWYKGIDILGAPIGMLLNSTYIIWIVLIENFIYQKEISFKFLLSLVIILFSIFILVVDNRREV